MAEGLEMGGREAPTGLERDLPPVTFVVFAFNQEAMIDEAIDAAFAQDYPNLQVLLSDDGSSDATFEIMRRRAEAYRGPHRVAAIRTPRNAGIVHHVMCAVAVADGDLLVGAAGDDLSLPHRVSTLVKHWRHDRPAIIYSAWNRVDMAGRLLSRDGITDQHDRDLAAYFPEKSGIAAFGCTTAYATAFLRSVPDPGRPIWSEDYFLSAVAMLTGEHIVYVDAALVEYRQNPAAQRNFATVKVDHRAYEERESRFFDGLAALATALLDIIDRGVPAAKTRVNRDMIVRDIAWYRYRSDWARHGLGTRLRYTAGLRSRQRLRWAVPRLPGMELFLGAKRAMAGLRRAR